MYRDSAEGLGQCGELDRQGQECIRAYVDKFVVENCLGDHVREWLAAVPAALAREVVNSIKGRPPECGCSAYVEMVLQGTVDNEYGG